MLKITFVLIALALGFTACNRTQPTVENSTTTTSTETAAPAPEASPSPEVSPSTSP